MRTLWNRLKQLKAGWFLITETEWQQKAEQVLTDVEPLATLAEAAKAALKQQAQLLRIETSLAQLESDTLYLFLASGYSEKISLESGGLLVGTVAALRADIEAGHIKDLFSPLASWKAFALPAPISLEIY